MKRRTSILAALVVAATLSMRASAAPDPIKLGVSYAATIASSSADAFSSNLALTRQTSGAPNYNGRTSALRIAVAIQGGATARSVYLQIVRLSDGHREAVRLGSADLVAGDGNTFTWPADPAYSYNLRFSGSTVLSWASIEESQNDGL